MYRVFTAPKAMAKKNRYSLTVYQITLYGKGHEINDVAKQRLADSQCRQLPHIDPPQSHLVRIIYLIGEGDYLAINLMEVSFDTGKTWSIFYDPEHKREGIRRPLPSSPLQYYFLASNRLDEFIEVILRQRNKPALRHFIRHPEDLPEIEVNHPDLGESPTIEMKF